MAKEKTQEQLDAENAAQAAAQAEKDRLAQEKADKDAKELKDKLDAAMNEATAGYNTALQAHQGTTDSVATLNDASLLDDVKKVEETVAGFVKTAKDALKAVKAAARKVKDNEDLKGAVNSTTVLVEEIEASLKDVKGRISAARQATKEAEKLKREQEREQAAKQREEEKQRKAAERDALKEPEQNGIRKPSVNTLCRAAWDMFDAASSAVGQVAPISFVLPVALERGLNEANVKAEYARWKKYMGYEGRVDIPVPQAVRDALMSVALPEVVAETADVA